MSVIVKNMKMSDDCIRRSDVLNEIHRFRGYIDEDLEYRMKFEFNRIPSADVVEVKHGRWIKAVGENGITSACRCSNCGFEDNRYSLFNYCPRCGADMREES